MKEQRLRHPERAGVSELMSEFAESQEQLEQRLRSMRPQPVETLESEVLYVVCVVGIFIRGNKSFLRLVSVVHSRV